MSEHKTTMREIRYQWVEFMTTFVGKHHAPALESEFDEMLDQHNREVIVGALGRAKVTLPLENLASETFTASDGYLSVGMNTNDEAKNQVLKGLDDLMEQYLRGRA